MSAEVFGARMKNEIPNTPPARPRILRVAAVQMESRPGDKAANFARMESFVAQAAQQAVQLIVFPECCITGYWFIRNLAPEDLRKLAEPTFDGQARRHRKLQSFEHPLIESGTDYTVFDTPHGFRVGVLLTARTGRERDTRELKYEE